MRITAARGKYRNDLKEGHEALSHDVQVRVHHLPVQAGGRGRQERPERSDRVRAGDQGGRGQAQGVSQASRGRPGGREGTGR